MGWTDRASAMTSLDLIFAPTSKDKTTGDVRVILNQCHFTCSKVCLKVWFCWISQIRCDKTDELIKLVYGMGWGYYQLGIHYIIMGLRFIHKWGYILCNIPPNQNFTNFRLLSHWSQYQQSESKKDDLPLFLHNLTTTLKKDGSWLQHVPFSSKPTILKKDAPDCSTYPPPACPLF